MEGPRAIRKGEFRQLIRVLDRAYPEDRMHGMQRAYCHALSDRPADYHRYLILKENNRIVSHVGLIPMEVVIEGGSTVLVGGIGEVATDKEYRGRGLMSTLIDHSIRLMSERGYDLSWLCGDRQRYGRLGYENGGRAHVFELTPRSVACYPPATTSIQPYKGEQRYLNRIRAIHDKEPFRVSRTGRQYKLLFARAGQETLCAFRNRRLVSYLVFARDQKDQNKATVNEFGGDEAGFRDIIQHLVNVMGLEHLKVPAPCTFHPLKKVLSEGSGSYAVISTYGMLRIINLRSLLSKFEEQMTQKHMHGKQTGNIALVDSERGEKVTLKFGERVKVLGRGQAHHDVILSSREMVQVLFGLTRPSESFELGRAGPFLDAVFPLDFHIWALEKV